MLYNPKQTSWFGGEDPTSVPGVHSCTDILEYFPPTCISDPSSAPLSTNKWYSVLFLDPSTGKEKPTSNPAYPHPYRLTVETVTAPYGFHVAYPFVYRHRGPIAYDQAIQYYFHNPSVTDVIVTAAEWSKAPPKLLLDRWDDMGVQMIAYEGEQRMSCYAATGMAFLTVYYERLQPLVLLPCPCKQFCSAGTIGEYTKYLITLANNERWVLYLSDHATLVRETNEIFRGQDQFEGHLRLAILPNSNGRDEEENLYDAYCGCILKGSHVEMQKSPNTYRFVFDVSGDPSSSFLHFGLYHHAESFVYDNLSIVPNLHLNSSTHGKMQAYQTVCENGVAIWNFQENDIVPESLTFFVPKRMTDVLNAMGISKQTSPMPTTPTISSASKDLINDAQIPLKETQQPEASSFWKGISNVMSMCSSIFPTISSIKDFEKDFPDLPTCLPSSFIDILEGEIKDDSTWILDVCGSYYFNGKKIMKQGTLCLLTYCLSKRSSSYADLHTICLEKYKEAFGVFFQNKWQFPLVYDSVYGGIVSSQGYTVHDMHADFGNTMYNDHHYHYGYWILAAALLRLFSPDWEHISTVDQYVQLMIRDVFNASHEDRYFPVHRHLDWFLGHSYAHGLSPSIDGRDQESTSEEINFYYGCYLWGIVSQNKELTDCSSLVMKLLKRTTNMYFLLKTSNPIHPSDFLPNKVTGILFDNKVDYTTWFSRERECIHGIQMLPISPATYYLRDRQFVQEEWDSILKHLNVIQDPTISSTWQSLLYSNFAVLNKAAAIEKLISVPMDDGQSRAWAIFMAMMVDIG